jgi:hypothetical protein
MMWWSNGGTGWAGWLLMSVGMVAFWTSSWFATSWTLPDYSSRHGRAGLLSQCR